MRDYKTWYEPFDEQKDISKSLWYALNQGVTTAAMPANFHLWPKVIDAANRLRDIDAKEQS